jgi:hypothetical protein
MMGLYNIGRNCCTGTRYRYTGTGTGIAYINKHTLKFQINCNQLWWKSWALRLSLILFQQKSMCTVIHILGTVPVLHRQTAVLWVKLYLFRFRFVPVRIIVRSSFKVPEPLKTGVASYK